MTKSILMKSTDDVTRVNNMAINFDCDVYVHGKNVMVDAKSLLGLMALVGRDDLKLVFPDHLNFKIVEKELKKARLW